MSRIATFVAATTEAIQQTWHDYVRYLDAQLTLLDGGDSPDAAFERADAGDDAAAQARATLAAIPTARRVVFDTVLEQARQAALVAAEAAQRAGGGRGPLDPASVERDVLHHLHDEALGIGTPTPGRGLVPLAPETDAWYEVDVAALQDAPDAGAYLLQAADADERRSGFRRAGWVAGLGALALGLWALWTWGVSAPARDRAVSPAVGNVTVAAWPLRTLTLTTLTTTLTLPVQTTTATAWPTVDAAAPVAVWRAPTLLPLTLCLPPTLRDQATTIAVIGEPSQPVRRYRVDTTAPAGTPDLVLVACGAGQLPPHYGSLTEVQLPAEQQLATDMPVGDASVRVTAITEVGPGDDPTLPADTNAVVVALQTRTPLAWPTLAPTLLTEDGKTLTDGKRTAMVDGITFRYLVPRRSMPRVVVWQLTPQNGRSAIRWRATLPVPPTRLIVLQQRLAVEQVALTAQTARSLTLAIALKNTRDAPLLLTNADLELTADDRPLPLPALAALATPLAPQETRRMTVTLSRPGGAAALVLRIGPFRYALAP